MIHNIKKNLVKKTKNNRLFLGSTNSLFMEHLSCFAPGMFALGIIQNSTLTPDTDYKVAEGLTKSCYDLYLENKITHLAPDSFRFNLVNDDITVTDPRFDLRPETIESIFLMWRLTKKQLYREWGWNIFKSIQEHCHTSGGYSSLHNVYSKGSFKDEQPSFWMAEVLKYLFLLFSDDSVLPLDKFVLNTEAHPFRISNFTIFGHNGK